MSVRKIWHVQTAGRSRMPDLVTAEFVQTRMDKYAGVDCQCQDYGDVTACAGAGARPG